MRRDCHEGSCGEGHAVSKQSHDGVATWGGSDHGSASDTCTGRDGAQLAALPSHLAPLSCWGAGSWSSTLSASGLWRRPTTAAAILITARTSLTCRACTACPVSRWERGGRAPACVWGRMDEGGPPGDPSPTWPFDGAPACLLRIVRAVPACARCGRACRSLHRRASMPLHLHHGAPARSSRRECGSRRCRWSAKFGTRTK